jgi:DNA-binding NtrC family response regulator
MEAMETRSILIVEDEPKMREILQEDLAQNGFCIHPAANGAEALRLFEEKPIDLIISDVRLPDQNGIQLLQTVKSKAMNTPFILITGYGTVQDAVEAMKSGAFEYILKPFSLDVLHDVVQKALGDHKAVPQETLSRSKLATPIMTKDPKMEEILGLCRKVAPSKATVLLLGESGTGKELFSRYIHSQSPRSQGSYIAVNCASLPETLLESELFGHEKGAFTGAVNKKIGKFELANHGTILLDEISEMNTLLQAKILRVLQEGEVDRIGGRQPIPIDIRVIATTNRNLEEAIAKGEFREDLYYRLNVISIKLPPLRERPMDIVLLTHYFLKLFSESYGKPLRPVSDEAMAWLKKQEWRGNVRELKNMIERTVLIASRSPLDLKDFRPEVGDSSPKRPAGDSLDALPSLSLRDMEEKLIRQALEKTSGNRTHAAKMLGISIRTLRNKLNEYKQGLSSPEVS